MIEVPGGDFGGVAICCAYLSREGVEVTPASLRDTAARSLPPETVSAP